MKGLALHEVDHGIGDLDFGSYTWRLVCYFLKNFGLKDVTARDNQNGKCIGAFGLFYHLIDNERIAAGVADIWAMCSMMARSPRACATA